MKTWKSDAYAQSEIGSKQGKERERKVGKKLPRRPPAPWSKVPLAHIVPFFHFEFALRDGMK